ncbi:MAG TPA: hypothetical protein PKA64_18935, partial [Myxococcota bacterium]|nr:hypothetical protein [Myxococcota bacterium]
MKFRFNGDRVNLEQLNLVSDDGSRLDVGGTLSPRALDLDVGLQSDLSASKLFVQSVKEAYGPINLRLTVSGSPSQPVLVGQGNLTQGLLVVEGFPHKFKNLDTSISFIR